MLMRRILSCTVAVLLAMPLLAQVDPVVMTVNGYDVTQSEFEYFFEKNNIETNVTKKTVRQYADLYLNFKLKVQAAIDEGLDKSESFISEYKMCRDMQAEDYVIDNDFLEDVARSSYVNLIRTSQQTPCTIWQPIQTQVSQHQHPDGQQPYRPLQRAIHIYGHITHIQRLMDRALTQHLL